MAEYTVRTATREEIDTIIDWAAAEGWNPGLADGGPYFSADNEGYLVGLLDGEPISAISVVRYGDDYAFLGFYICRPEFRGHGHGLTIWNAAIARMDERTIGLDGVIEQQDNYKKSGFALAHRNIRYGGVAPASEGAAEDIVAVGDGSAFDEAVIDYDRQFFPADRDRFMRLWIAPPHRTLAHVENGKVRGFGTIRACRNGHKVGPLFADNRAIADGLFRALTAPYAGEEVFLDVPEPNDDAVALAESYQMKPVFETARMYRGVTPDLPLERKFGITTFELG